MTRRRGHAHVLRSINTALGLGLHPLKLNVVVMRGVNDDEIADFVELTRERPINVSRRHASHTPYVALAMLPARCGGVGSSSGGCCGGSSHVLAHLTASSSGGGSESGSRGCIGIGWLGRGEA